ncbi:MAG: ABC transporter permease [Bacteroidales bacterium]|nr:ABC transporter permease [Bacteroidales bacterium]MCF8327132.1 ABC transporter permease [Bacteroidales bacterium]
MGPLYHLGRYALLIKRAFKKPDRQKVFWRRVLNEIDKLGVSSLGIVLIISVFVGAVVALQAAFNMESPWIPDYAVGLTTRQSIILEFSPTIISVILAGKVGSSISSEIGSMRISEQIDAMEIMGVNPASLLVAPKVLAAMLINPFLITLSMAVGIFGGWLGALASGALTGEMYVFGIKSFFHLYDIFYALFKTVIFAFIITSVSSYYGYFVKGGSIEVGHASTRAVVSSSILIIFANLILTQLMLT